jgi:hypothetical protein
MVTLAVVLAVWQPAPATERPAEIGEAGQSTEAPKAGADVPVQQQPASAPELTGVGNIAQQNALAFIDWAAASTMQQTQSLRTALAAARENKDIVTTFCTEALRVQQSDHSRALVALGLLGEMRSAFGEECLVEFVAQPLPQTGTVVDGEILEQTALATLQAKAIDGLAFLGTSSADRAVLEAVGQHPSRIVRAEAIAAYLSNHKNAAEARATLARYVRSGEEIFLDRPVREAGERAETFNPKVEAFLKAHPELHPPAPEQRRSQ